MSNNLGELCGYILFTSNNNFNFFCTNCQTSFACSETFQNHALQEHLNYKENECHISLIDEKLDLISDNENDFQNTSPIPGVEETNDNLQEKIPNETESFICEYCSKQFLNKIKLDEHIEFHINFVLTCDICGKHSREKRIAEHHKRGHRKTQCDRCDISFVSKQALENHLKRHESLKCKYCPKFFKQLYAIQRHILTHTGEKPFKCSSCDATFALKTNLTRHIATQHTGNDKNFKCNDCDKKFKTRNLRYIHIKRVHLKERPHQCEFCGLSYASMSDLTRHKFKNHAEQAHKCHQCNKTCVSGKDLAEHMNTHTGDKPYKCNNFSECFATQSLIRIHEKQHVNQSKINEELIK